MVDLAALPIAAAAKLPQLYTAAKVALEKCAHVDECKTWADKAAALASYAKQARDEALFKTARRIQARAIDRAGALLKQFDARGGDRTKSSTSATSASRKEAAKKAGMSRDQQVRAVRVNGVPREQFESLVESENPPTVKALADMGKRPTKPVLDLGGRSPEDFKAATTLIGAIRSFRRALESIDIKAAARGASPDEVRELKSDLRWLTKSIDSVMERL